MVTLEEFRTITNTVTDSAEKSAVARLYQRYRKEKPAGDAAEYIRQHLPPSDYVLTRKVAESFDKRLADTEDRIRKWCLKHKKDVLDTVEGWAISEETSVALETYCSLTHSVTDVVNSVCDCPVELKTYAYIRKLAGKSIVSENWHPLSYDTFFFYGDAEEARMLARALLAEHLQDSDEKQRTDYFTSGLAAKYFHVSSRTMTLWMEANKSRCVFLCGHLLLRKKDAKKISAEWATVIPLDKERLASILRVPEELAELLAKEAVKYRTDLESLVIAATSFPAQNEALLYCKNQEQAYDAAIVLRKSASAYPVQMLAKTLGCSTTMLKKRLAKIRGKAQPSDGEESTTLFEYCEILRTSQTFVPLDDVISDMLNDQSKFRLIKKDVAALLRRCEENDWWGIEHLDAEGTILEAPKTGKLISRGSQTLFQDNNRLFLATYKATPQEQFEIYCLHYSNKYPIAVRELITFSKTDAKERMQALCEMADLLFSWLDERACDIDALDDKAFLELAVVFDESALRISCKLLSTFLVSSGYFSSEITFSETGLHTDVSHYPLEDYLTMARYVFDKSCWEKHSLVKKAINSRRNAQFWLFVVLHFASALRTTDLERLDPPFLGGDPREILDQIQNGDFPDEKAIAIYLAFAGINGAYQLTPNKTAKTNGVPTIYLMCPSSFQVEFGTILAIATAHYQMEGGNGKFIETYFRYYDVKRFFGDEFGAACGMRKFSTRRANKSLMQSIFDQSQEDGESAYKAYLQVSTMRSHKVPVYMVSETTARYLSPVVDGLSPELVAFQMFERGSCSYMVDALLELCFGRKYKRLSFSDRTKVIQDFGLTPYELSCLRDDVLAAEEKAAETIRGLGLTSEDAGGAIIRILSDQAHNKNMDGDCLMAAINRSCARTDLQACRYCPFSILYQASFLRLTAERQRLKLMLDHAVNEQERKRIAYISDTLIRPAQSALVDHAAEANQLGLLKTMKTLKNTFKELKGELDEHCVYT